MPFPIDVVRQLRQAYLDMPGLSLTPTQMRRLFNADDEQCAAAVAALVDTRLITRRGEQYVRVITWELSAAEAMRLRAAPFDCRWAEPELAAPPPSWLALQCGGWMCVRDGGPRALDVRDCLACPRWDPRLTTRRRAHQAGLAPGFSAPSVPRLATDQQPRHG